MLLLENDEGVRGFISRATYPLHHQRVPVIGGKRSGAPTPTTDEQEQRLLALKAWYDDWSETARALFTKRGDLIKLGLAHPRAAAAPADPAPAPPPPAPAAPPAAPGAPHV